MMDYEVSGGMCVLRLNSPPLNTMTFSLLEEGTDALAIDGATVEFGFSVGALGPENGGGSLSIREGGLYSTS